MSKIFYSDFRDFLHALNSSKVKFLLVGGYAVVFHGYPRMTGDIDVWVERSEENYAALQDAFKKFKMPLFDMTSENFLKNEKLDVFRFGRNPIAIDIMTKMSNFDFNEYYKRKVDFIDGDLVIPVINLPDLIHAKKVANRFKDKDDIEKLSR